MATPELGAWLPCPTEIDRPIRIAGLFRIYQLGLAVVFWLIYASAELHAFSGLVSLAVPALYLVVVAIFSEQMAPRFVLHWMHYLQLIPFRRLLFPGFLEPKRIIFQPWG